jgi:hypothetical protein
MTLRIWIGVLIAALAIGFIFFYKTLIPGDYQSSVMKYQYSVPKSKSVPKYQQKAGASKSAQSSKSSKGYTSIGTPDGN